MITEIIFYTFWSFFALINLYLIYFDIKYKKIPNKGIIALIVLALLGFIFFSLLHISWILLGWILINIILSFTLFYYDLWSAGDAKYVIVLSLFLPAGGLIYTLGNIGLITLLYLSLYTIYTYIIKSLFSYSYSKELGGKIYQDIYSKLYTFFVTPENTITFKSVIKKIIPVLIGFLILFTVLRLIRIYIVNAYIEEVSSSGSGQRSQFFIELIQEYNMYILLGIIVGIYLIYRFSRNYLEKGFTYTCEKLKISEDIGKIFGLSFFTLGLMGFIAYEYVHDPITIQESLIRIFTFYIFLWLFIKFLIYIHYVTFQLGEVIYKTIKKLSPGDIVDIPFLTQIFGTQKVLGYEQDTGKYAPEPKNFFESIENPISNATCFEIKSIYKTVNLYHRKEKTPGYEKIEAIKVLKTFAFAPYIFAGCVISLLYQNALLTNITEYIMKLILGE